MNVVLEATAETPNDISAVDDATNPPLELQVLGIGRVQVKVLARTCNCEASPEQVENGKIVCGVATCAPGYSGARCQCMVDIYMLVPEFMYMITKAP
jgi:hypothetical protein